MDRKIFLALVAFAFLAGVLVVVITIIGPFLRALVWAGIVGILTFPLYRRLRARVGQRHNLAAAIMTPLVVATLVLPIVALTILMTQEVANLYHLIEGQTAAPHSLISSLTEYPRLQALLQGLEPTLEKYGIATDRPFLQSVQKGMTFLLGYSTSIFRNFLSFCVKLLMMIIALFFVYRDGEAFQENFWSVIPLREDHKHLLSRTVKNVLSAVIYGVLLTCLCQGLLAGLGYWVCDLPSPLVLGFLTAGAALVPIVGAALVWAPAGVYLLAQEQVGMAVGLLLWGAFVVSTIDNVLRPLFISGRGKLPILPVALGILGGLAAFGFVGLVLGPLVLILFLEIFRIYRDQQIAGDPAALAVHTQPGPAERGGSTGL